MENQNFGHSVAPFEIPKDGLPIFQIGDFEFLWNAENTHICIDELNQDLYFELSAETSSIEEAKQQGVLSDVNDTGEISIKFHLKNIFLNEVPTGTTVFSDGKTAEWQQMVIEGTDFGLEFSGNVTCENGWVGFNGYLKASYEEEPVFEVKIYQNFNAADLRWEHYHFNFLEEARTANPATVRHLTIQNPDFEEIPEEIFNFANLETLALLRLSAPPLYEQAPKLPLSTIDDRVARLSKLKWLQVLDTPLTTLPESLGQLENLEYLGFFRCELSALPDGAWKLPNLKTLHLQENRISKIPDDVHLSNLSELGISGNPLVDTQPTLASLFVWLYKPNSRVFLPKRVNGGA